MQGVCDHQRHKRLHLLQNCSLSAGHSSKAAQVKKPDGAWFCLHTGTGLTWGPCVCARVCLHSSSHKQTVHTYVDMLLCTICPLSLLAPNVKSPALWCPIIGLLLTWWLWLGNNLVMQCCYGSHSVHIFSLCGGRNAVFNWGQPDPYCSVSKHGPHGLICSCSNMAATEHWAISLHAMGMGCTSTQLEV